MQVQQQQAPQQTQDLSAQLLTVDGQVKAFVWEPKSRIVDGKAYVLVQGAVYDQASGNCFDAQGN